MGEGAYSDPIFDGVPISKKEGVEESNADEMERVIAAQKKVKEEEERKNKVKTTIVRLFKQMKDGCRKDICFDQYCAKNPLCKYHTS